MIKLLKNIENVCFYQERILVVKDAFGDHFRTPTLVRPLQGLSGNPLSDEMKTFQDSARKSFESFLDKVIDQKLSFHKLSSKQLFDCPSFRAFASKAWTPRTVLRPFVNE